MTAAEARMEKDRAMDTLEEFSHCLRHAFSAKNSLSRVNGFTPEQCLLGKSRKLPGSLTADSDASSHSLAESSLPERVRFKEKLLRREHARKAFVQAGNDSFFRRALLRQSRPGKVEYEAGDWVLYWRKTKGGSRIERGRWHGPAQVITVQQPRVLWLSHLGRLIRASPEQIRPASLREHSFLPKGVDGKVVDNSLWEGGISTLEWGPPKMTVHWKVSPMCDSTDEIPVEGGGAPSKFSYAPTTPLESQPEQEEFPRDPANPSESEDQRELTGENGLGNPKENDMFLYLMMG